MDVVKALGECGLVNILEFGRETIWPDSFPIRHTLKCFRHLVHGWIIFKRQLERSRRQEFDDRVQEFVAKTPPIVHEFTPYTVNACHPRP